VGPRRFPLKILLLTNRKHVSYVKKEEKKSWRLVYDGGLASSGQVPDEWTDLLVTRRPWKLGAKANISGRYIISSAEFATNFGTILPDWEPG